MACWSQTGIMLELSNCGREPLVRRAIEEGIVRLDVAGYLREQEQAADARERAEEAAAQAAVRRARNEKRRQKKKKGKARRRAAEGSGGGKEEEEDDDADDEQEQELAAAMVGLNAGDSAAAGAEGVAAEAAVAEEEQQPSAAVTAPAAATDPEEEAMLEAAIAVSPVSVVARPPPLEEYLEAEAPEGLLCPISMALLDDPVVLAADGITYSRAAIEQHFAFCRERGKPLSSPSTNVEITDAALTMLVPNVFVRGLVLEYKAAKERAWAEAERRWREAEGMVAGKKAK